MMTRKEWEQALETHEKFIKQANTDFEYHTFMRDAINSHLNRMAPDAE